MNTLSCPVCDRPEIEGDTCPNCETNLSLFRTLVELPGVTKTVLLPKSKRQWHKSWWLIGIFFLLLIVGISLGTFSSYFLFQRHLSAQLLTPASEQIPGQSLPQKYAKASSSSVPVPAKATVQPQGMNNYLGSTP